MTVFKAVIRADYARLIQPFVSDDPKRRYYLQGFHVEPHPGGGVFIVATRGDVMGVFHDADGWCEGTGIVQLDKAMLAACKAGKRSDEMQRWLAVAGGDSAGVGRAGVFIAGDLRGNKTAAREHYEGVMAMLANPGTAMRAMQVNALIDGTFPDWRRVIPTPSETAGEPSAFDPDLIARFATVAKTDPHSFAPIKGAPLHIRGTGSPDAPAIVVANRGDFFGVIMPLRIANNAGALPAWLNATRPISDSRCA